MHRRGLSPQNSSELSILKLIMEVTYRNVCHDLKVHSYGKNSNGKQRFPARYCPPQVCLRMKLRVFLITETLTSVSKCGFNAALSVLRCRCPRWLLALTEKGQGAGTRSLLPRVLHNVGAQLFSGSPSDTFITSSKVELLSWGCTHTTTDWRTRAKAVCCPSVFWSLRV